MNVVDRYLRAVRVFLPRAAQRDIIAELSEDLRSRIEDREAGLGRTLTEDEQESLVKELGHPALLAGRYGPRRHLIGPELFPFYWFVLKLALGVGVAVQAAIAIAMFAGGRTGQAIRQVIVELPIVAWVQFGVITLGFAALDAYGVMARFGHQWSPRSLPAPAARPQPILRLAFTALGAAWWLTALREPFLIFGPAAAVVGLAPIWRSLFVPILLLMLAAMAVQVVELIRPQWSRVESVAQFVMEGLTLALLYVLLRAGEWVVMVDPARQPDGVQGVVHVLNQAFPWGFAFTAIGLVAAMLSRLWRLRMSGASGRGASQTL